MQPELFTYPSYSEPLAEAYCGRFESAFIVLHPFIRVPEYLAWNVSKHYPDDATIVAYGARFPWAEVAVCTSLQTCAHINQALLSAIGSLDAHLADPSARDVLQSFLHSHPVWMPVEGRFEPLLQPDFLAAFDAARIDKLVFVPEFPQAGPVTRIPIASLRTGEIPFPSRGTLLAPDGSFLFTVDWDSFFTLFYGSRAFVTRVVSQQNIEGFFATPNTEHAWFNYSFGCATVTLSPEHWQTK